ncbi:MAG: N-acetylmuramoyl-L-alanine amidase [Aliarcobacter sp.]|nr:N-acetylmuramoyl-L-alanine amidase [Aliarcobacter sp.]
MNYLKAVMQNDEQLKIDELKNIISIGKKLNKDIRPDEKKLEILLGRQISINSKTTNKLPENNIEKNQVKEKVVIKNEPENNILKTESLNIDTVSPIRSISTNENKIVVKFNKNYVKNDIKQISQKIASNYVYSFDIVGKYKYTIPTKLEINNIDNISVNDEKASVNIKISNKENTKITYSLAPRELIITVNNQQLNVATKKESPKTIETPLNLPSSITSSIKSESKPRNKVIVLDAGHGADDVGAVGPNNRYEKVINLNVTKYVGAILKQRGYTVFLTRNNDTFIKVMDRTVLANEKNADLFISIHTNAVPKEKANEVDGIETFFLSPARNERAKRVAALENKTDIREMSNSSKDVFLESLNRPRITASHKFAIDIQSGILQSARSKYKDIKDSGVREGPFWVLVGAQMPSILVELGYVSHPTESKRLYDKAYQQLLANGISNGVDSYFSKNP